MEQANEPAAIEPACLERLLKRQPRLRSHQQLYPYAHGHFDGLCGLYSALNGLRLLSAECRKPLDDAQCETLFRDGIRWLQDRQRLSDALRYGLRMRSWVALLKRLTSRAARMLGLDIVVERPFRGLKAVPLGLIVEATAQAVQDRKPVLLLLKGAYGGYTVVCGVSPARLRLFDSYGRSWIRIRSCLPAAKGRAPRHQIDVASITFLAA
ncbi:hypothetical protein [Sphingomonas bacterium]|uniref:hypothetical protein n=1 Tax=Sphingomonas bacterium TaxID=1895847 RepID=UPI00157774D8|nr:hypothetical protein [Sphingomonas bacterium]